VPFDCLEFNPQLRHIDVMADLAFTFMDLQRHGLKAWAWRLVNGYAEHTGDYSGLATLRFFAVYRAMVRAKVALLRAEQHDEAAQSAFERDLRLAQTLSAASTSSPRLVMTSGVSGSGKSTVAQMLVESLGAIRLRSDVERKRLFGMAALARGGTQQLAQVYSAEATALTYARLETLAVTLLGAGIPVVVDAAFLKRNERERMRAVAARYGTQAVLIDCHAPEAVLRSRVQHRMAADTDASDADLDVLAMQLTIREPIGDDEKPCRIDTDADLVATRAAAMRCLGIA
jgi:predicted kinase